jgi:hypothetical protein
MLSRSVRLDLALGFLTPFVVLVGLAVASLILGGDAIDARSPAKDCSTCSEHDKADLYEQRRMAKVAEWQAWISGIGMLALVVTLFLNWHATNAATKAAEETARAVDVQIRIEQPLLFFRMASNVDPPDWQRIDLFVDNYGKTPAVIIEWAAECRGRCSA